MVLTQTLGVISDCYRDGRRFDLWFLYIPLLKQSVQSDSDKGSVRHTAIMNFLIVFSWLVH